MIGLRLLVTGAAEVDVVRVMNGGLQRGPVLLSRLDVDERLVGLVGLVGREAGYED